MHAALMGHPLLQEGWKHALRKREEEGSEGQIIALFDQGGTPVEIGRALGLHHLAVYRKLVKAGKVPHKR